MRSCFALVLSVVIVGVSAPPGFGDEAQMIRLASAVIGTGEKATNLERLAAKEVQRYLYRISGKVLPIGEEAPGSRPRRGL